MALKDKPDVPFRAPLGIKLISVDYHSGMRSNGKDSIIEAFKPGTAPPDSYAVIDGAAPRAARSDGGGSGGTAGDADRAVGRRPLLRPGAVVERGPRQASARARSSGVLTLRNGS